MHSPELLKGTLQTIVLKLLADNGKMYGYEITQRVKDLTSGTIILTEGALYPTLHKLESEGLLNTETQFVGKRVRKYYSLTKSGRNSVQQRIREVKAFVTTINQLLDIQLT